MAWALPVRVADSLSGANTLCEAVVCVMPHSQLLAPPLLPPVVFPPLVLPPLVLPPGVPVLPVVPLGLVAPVSWVPLGLVVASGLVLGSPGFPGLPGSPPGSPGLGSPGFPGLPGLPEGAQFCPGGQTQP